MQVVNGCRFLTVGDEEGSVSIVDTWSNQLPSSLYTDHDTPPRAKWLAHNNAIFDVAWAKVNNHKLIIDFDCNHVVSTLSPGVGAQQLSTGTNKPLSVHLN